MSIASTPATDRATNRAGCGGDRDRRRLAGVSSRSGSGDRGTVRRRPSAVRGPRPLFTDRVQTGTLQVRMLNATHSCRPISWPRRSRFVDEAIAIRQWETRALPRDGGYPDPREIPGIRRPSTATVLAVTRTRGARSDRGLWHRRTAKFPSSDPDDRAAAQLAVPSRCAALALAGWARYLATVPEAERAPDPQGISRRLLAVRRSPTRRSPSARPRLHASHP